MQKGVDSGVEKRRQGPAERGREAQRHVGRALRRRLYAQMVLLAAMEATRQLTTEKGERTRRRRLACAVSLAATAPPPPRAAASSAARSSTGASRGSPLEESQTRCLPEFLPPPPQRCAPRRRRERCGRRETRGRRRAAGSARARRLPCCCQGVSPPRACGRGVGSGRLLPIRWQYSGEEKRR